MSLRSRHLAELMDLRISYVTIASSGQQVVGQNLDRVCLMLSGLGAQTETLFGPDAKVDALHGFAVPNGTPLTLEFSKHGLLVCVPWYVFGDMTGGVVTVIEVLWNREE